MTFFTWLGQQAKRHDAVGDFARYALRDKAFPRHNPRLHICLLRYEHMPAQRAAVKKAHAEFRRSRQQAAA